MLMVLDEDWDVDLAVKQEDEDDRYRITARDIYLEKLWRQKHQPDEEDR